MRCEECTSSRVRLDAQRASRRVYGVALSGDGSRLLVGGKGAYVRMYALGDAREGGMASQGRSLWRYWIGAVTVNAVAISTDGALCAFAGRFADIRVCSGVSGALLHSLPVESPVHSLHIPARSHRLLAGGEEGLLSLYDMRSGVEQLCVPCDAQVNCVHASKHSLLCATSRHALMLGSTGAHYDWSDKPSFSVLVKLVHDSGERALRCLRWVKARHPEIVNMREPDTARTFLQFLLSASSVQLDNVDLFSELLEGSHEISLQPDAGGNNVLSDAIDGSRKAAIWLLLQAAADGRVSTIPSALGQVTRYFKDLADVHPVAFLRFLSRLGLEQECEGYDLIEVTAHGQYLPDVRGSEDRVVPRSFWAGLAMDADAGSGGLEEGSLEVNDYVAPLGLGEESLPFVMVPPRIVGGRVVPARTQSIPKVQEEQSRVTVSRDLAEVAMAAARQREPLPGISDWPLPSERGRHASVCCDAPSSSPLKRGGGGETATELRLVSSADAPPSPLLPGRRTATAPPAMDDDADCGPSFAAPSVPRLPSGLRRRRQGAVKARMLRVPIEALAAHYEEGSSHPSPLALIIRASDWTQDRSCYQSELVQLLLQHKWQAYGVSLYKFQAGMHLAYLVLNTLFAACYINALHGHLAVARGDGAVTRGVPEPAVNEMLEGGLRLLWLPVTAYTLYLLFHECVQMRVMQYGGKYWHSVWNWFDLLSISMQLLANGYLLAEVAALHLAGGSALPLMFNARRVLLGLQLTMSYIKLIYYLRGSRVLALQVRVVVQIMQDLVPYLVILLVCMLSFAAGLSVLLFNNSRAYDDGDFASPTFALLSVLNYGLYSEFGDFFDVFSIDFCEATGETPLLPPMGNETGGAIPREHHGPSMSCSRHLDLPSVLVFNCMMFLVQIVLLNLLIAIMSDSYAKVRENSRLESLHERAMLLAELEAAWLPLLASWFGAERVYSAEKFPMWLHVLKPVEQDLAAAAADQSRSMHVTFGGRAWLPAGRRREAEPEPDTRHLERSRLLDDVNAKLDDKLGEVSEHLRRELRASMDAMRATLDSHTGSSPSGEQTARWARARSPRSRAGGELRKSTANRETADAEHESSQGPLKHGSSHSLLAFPMSRDRCSNKNDESFIEASHSRRGASPYSKRCSAQTTSADPSAGHRAPSPEGGALLSPGREAAPAAAAGQTPRGAGARPDEAAQARGPVAQPTLEDYRAGAQQVELRESMRRRSDAQGSSGTIRRARCSGSFESTRSLAGAEGSAPVPRMGERSSALH